MTQAPYRSRCRTVAAILLGFAALSTGSASAQRVEFVRPPGMIALPNIQPVPRRTTAGVRPPFFREPTIAEKTRERRALRRRLDASEIDPQIPQIRSAPANVPRFSVGTRQTDRDRGGALATSRTGIPDRRIEVEALRPRRP